MTFLEKITERCSLPDTRSLIAYGGYLDAPSSLNVQ
jgi:hypothetical protein